MMSDRNSDARDGRIPLRVRVGVSGHRHIRGDARLEARVEEALGSIRRLAPVSAATPVTFTVVSALAEGADRLVARAVLEAAGADLEAPLPLPRDDYTRDFESDASKREFADLLAKAREVTELPTRGTRSDAYAQVGRYIVDRCDVLTAIWDGDAARGEGGTADVVAYARQRGTPLVWIDPARAGGIVVEAAEVGGRSRLEIDRFNRSAISRTGFEREVRRQTLKRVDGAARAGGSGLPVRALSDWLWPYYVRADLLAERYQRWYQALGTGLFLMAAGAVAAAAAQVLFAPDTPQLGWVEIGLMLGLLAIVWIGRRRRLHDRWISYRFLAERFRSAFFLALAGLGERREGGAARLHLGHETEEWLRRAFAEVWSARPRVEPTAVDVEPLRRFLADAWIDDQAAYHRRASERNERGHRWVTAAIAGLFALTLVAALLHSVGFGGHEEEHGTEAAGGFPTADMLTFLAIALPALGGALGGIRAQQEFVRQAERFAMMVHHLGAAADRMRAAQDLDTIRAVAAEAEDLMLEENRDWFVVVRFHDFELHV
jgi:hypothetical protein